MNSEQSISVTDTSGHYIYVNDAFCQLTGYDRATLLSFDSHQVTHAKMPKSVLAEISQTLRQGLSWQGILPISDANSNEIWLDAFITPQYENDKIVGFQSISKVAEKKLSINARKIYKALSKQQKWATYEISKNHKFALLILLSAISQFFIFTELGLMMSIIAAGSALAPIAVFWHDIIPTALRAQKMQNTYDSISRKVYFGKGTASVFDFNFSMIKTKLKAILERTLDASKPIQHVMEKVCTGVGATRDTLQQQKNEVDQLSTAMSQMGESTTDIANNTVTAASELDKIYSQCEEAQAEIHTTTLKIKNLADEVEAASSSAEQLTESANNVGNLMEEIQSIADQTNLLALNAAIEAARAGEHGRGFAVVAEEVRNLSSRTQDSAEEIHQRLSVMLNTISQWVSMMEKNKLDAELCVKTAEYSNDKIALVVENVQEITAVAGQIATAAEEQTAVTNEVNNSINQIQSTIEQTWQQTDIVNEQMETLKSSVDDIANIASTFIPPKR